MGRSRNTLLPKAVVSKVMQEHGAIRVSSKAVDVLVNYLDKEGITISKKAMIKAMHAGRKTVTREDVQ
jgi:DNA-binding protein